jgi:tRNA (guanine37-N1)-methyltransferase
MHFSVLTIFPDIFSSFLKYGIMRRAIARRQITVQTVNIREYAEDKHRVTDDRPYGGGYGMVMKPEPLAAAIRTAKSRRPAAATILLSPQGVRLNQEIARKLSASAALILICGRYEGVDERICQNYVDLEISIGDYILTGGEPAAMVIMDAVTRLIPGVLGGEGSAASDSFDNGLLEHAQYTRPPDFEGDTPPPVLLSGDHQAIDQWRLESSLIRTFLKRGDLLQHRDLSREEIDILKRWTQAIEKLIRAQSSSGTGSLSGGQ